MEPEICPTCGNKITVIDKRKRGYYILITSGILLPVFLAFLIYGGTPVPLLFWLVLLGIGIAWTVKKDRYVAVCKSCLEVRPDEMN